VEQVNSEAHNNRTEVNYLSFEYSHSLQIMVNIVKRKNEEQSQRKHYMGFLVCRGATKALGEGSTVHLPVLLCNGTVRTTRAVHFLLQKFFDCSISALQLSQEDLAWLCAIQADEKDTSKRTSQVEMMFTFPQLAVRNTIQFKIPLKSLKYLWERYVCIVHSAFTLMSA
jgi:hypothetical protein